METPKSRRLWLMAAPLMLLLALCVFPAVRPLVISQWNILFNSPTGYTWVLRDQGLSKGLPEGDPETEQAALRSASLRNALDYQTQLAYALKADWKQVPGKPDERVVRLIALTGRFPARPTLYAHILRYATYFDVQVRRSNELRVNLFGEKAIENPEGGPDVAPPDTSSRLAEFDKFAAGGEQLEPDNAYFPMMRAAGLFAARRDKEALDALRRASRKSHWDDHIDEEAESDWKLLRQAFGEQSAVLRSLLQNSVVHSTIPHMDALKDVGQMAVYEAVLAEKAGRAGEGYEIRRAMARCAVLMRTQSRSLPGARRGVDILRDVTLRPGGVVLEEDVNISTEQRVQARLEAYYAYLRKIGHPEEAKWVQQEIEAGARVLALQENLSPYGQPVRRLSTLWMGDFVLLTNALEAMALIITSLVLVRIRPVRSTVLPEPRGSQVSSFAIALLIFFVAFSILTFQTQWGPAFGSLRTKVGELMSTGNEGHSSLLDNLTSADMIRTTLMIVSLAMPVLILLGLGMVAHLRREPIVATIIQKMAPVSAVIALVLVLLYGGFAFLTARNEAQLHAALDRVLLNEARYDAELTEQNSVNAPGIR